MKISTAVSGRILQLCSIGVAFALNALAAGSAPLYSENFEIYDADANIVRFLAGDPNHYRANKSSVVLGNAHSGEKSFLLDVETDADYPLKFLYFQNAENKVRISPQPGQKLEGWIKLGEGTSPDLKVSLGVNLILPQALDGASKTAQLALKVVETGENGWQKVQSEDIAEFAKKVGRWNNWNPEGAILESWLIHITGPEDLKNKRIVVSIDEIALK